MNGTDLTHSVIMIIIVAVLFWLVAWLITYIGINEPFNKILKVILALATFIFCANILLSLLGHPFIHW